MGRQIIVQPDGKLCVWSSSVDALVWWDFTDDELIEERVKRAAADERLRVTEEIAEVRGAPDHPVNPRPYFQFTKPFAEAYGEHLARGAEPLDFETPMADWPDDVRAAVEAARSRWVADLEEASRG